MPVEERLLAAGAMAPRVERRSEGWPGAMGTTLIPGTLQMRALETSEDTTTMEKTTRRGTTATMAPMVPTSMFAPSY